MSWLDFAKKHYQINVKNSLFSYAENFIFPNSSRLYMMNNDSENESLKKQLENLEKYRLFSFVMGFTSFFVGLLGLFFKKSLAYNEELREKELDLLEKELDLEEQKVQSQKQMLDAIEFFLKITKWIK